MIDFSIGQPDCSFFNIKMLKNIKLSKRNIKDFFYYSSKQGNEKLIQIFSELFCQNIHFDNNMIISYGNLYAIELIVKSYPHIKNVYVFLPTYKEALSIFHCYNIQIKQIPCSINNINFDEFELILEEDDFKTIYELICEKEGITNCDVVSLSKVQ